MTKAMFNPTEVTELAELVRTRKSPFSIIGGDTCGVTFGENDTVSTSQLSGVALYEPEAMTLVAKAGTPLAEIETLLAGENQRLAFEPPDLRGLTGQTGEPTLGGVVATNSSGPRRVAIGACRDAALGVEFVDGQGRVLRNGGRVMKNVTGYDLVKLMAGSYGTLGVLTEVSLKVLPKPECVGVLLINGLSDTEALSVMSAALGSPFELTGVAHVPTGIDGHPVTMLRIEGFEESVRYRIEQLRQRVAPTYDTQSEFSADRTTAGWRWVCDVELFHNRPGNVWRISVKPSDAPMLVSQINTDRVLYDWGGGLVWLLTSPDEDVRDKMKGIEGHATLVRGTGYNRFHPENQVVAKLSQSLRQKFDPRGLLNPGLMG